MCQKEIVDLFILIGVGKNDFLHRFFQTLALVLMLRGGKKMGRMMSSKARAKKTIERVRQILN